MSESAGHLFFFVNLLSRSSKIARVTPSGSIVSFLEGAEGAVATFAFATVRRVLFKIVFSVMLLSLSVPGRMSVLGFNYVFLGCGMFPRAKKVWTVKDHKHTQ